MTNRKDEWEVHDSRAQHYHENQWKNPKQSTKAFFNFAKIELSQSSHILDCGGVVVQVSILLHSCPRFNLPFLTTRLN